MTFFEHLVELRKRHHQFIDCDRDRRVRRVFIAKYVIDFVTRPMLKALVDAPGVASWSIRTQQA
jgi:hypothetical protein